MMEVDVMDGEDIVLCEPIDRDKVRAKIFEVRGLRVMLDRDVAKSGGV